MSPFVSVRRVLGALLVAGAVVIALAAAGAAQTADAPWPMVGRDAAHGAAADGPAPPYSVAWSSDVPQAPLAGPVVAAEALIAVGKSSVAALDPATGDTLWEQERTEGPAGPPAVAGDVVVHASGSGSGTALVARTIERGIEQWRAFIGSTVPGGPAVVADRIFVATRDGSVVALDAGDGEVVWEAEVGARVDGAPAASEDVVVVVSEDRETTRATVLALDASSGEETWRFSPEAFALGSSSTALDEEAAYVGTGDGRIRALDLETGDVLWEAVALAGTAGFRARHVPAAAADVLVPDLRALHAVEPSSGRERWTYQLSAVLKSTSPAVVGDWVVFGDAEGEAAAVDVGSGRLVWRGDVGDGSIGSPAVDAERVYLSAQGEDGAVVALEHDPDARLLDVPSPTTLFPLRALANFAAAAALVAAAALALFRYLVRDAEPAPAVEEAT